MTKSLKEKAVKIQGKSYVLVSDRVLFFSEAFPNGSIETTLLSRPEDQMIVVKATVIPDCANPSRLFTGHAQEVIGEGYINKTSALENAETSAVGRALGMLGIGVIESIASADEIVKAKNREVSTAQQLYGSKKVCPNCNKEHAGRYAKCLDCWKVGKDAKPEVKNASEGTVGPSVASLEGLRPLIITRPNAESLEEPPLPDEPPF